MNGAWWTYGLVAAVALLGLAATLWIGGSRENREGNPAYDRNSVPNWIRLTIIYILAAAVLFITGRPDPI